MRTLAIALVLIGCSASEAGPTPSGFECQLGGGLPGTWRVSYVETNGTCGALPDEVYIGPGYIGGADGCTRDQVVRSDDGCTLDTSFTCSTTDSLGTSDWVVSVEQVSSGRVTGIMNLQLTHPDASCRSTYDVEMVRQ